jgi:hypothetical protein
MRKQGKGMGRTSSNGIRRLTLVGIAVAVFALGVTAAVSLRSGQAKPSAPSAVLQPNGNTRNLSLRAVAQEIAVGGQQGQIRPLTQEEAQRLADGIKELTNQSTDGLQAVRHADGSVSLDLEGRFQSVAVARRDEDGKLNQSCVDNPKAAAAFFGIDPQLVGVTRGGASPKADSPQAEGRDQ